ncbi:unnamed protein product [Orchesella dallaii]|uniref:Uncharacterized protein n=1 Tax=Orchesella dallaii TaxID=48710 RepID=A0ABP1QVT5_9HEXA
MFSGEGVGGEVLPVVMEVEVTTTPSDSEEGGCRQHDRPRSNSALNPPLPINRTPPFRNAKGFGNWLYEQLDGKTFMKVYLRFIRYCQNFKIHELVRFGKCYFRDVERLHFLKGVFIVAPSQEQKKYVNRLLEKEWQKMLRRRN